jgi:hypothetical protein
MRRWRQSRFFAIDLALTCLVAVVIVTLALADPSSKSTVATAMDVAVPTHPVPGSRPIPPSFLGLSLEYPALATYAGADPAAVNPVFEQLVRNLSPGQSPVIRVGGDSADWTWWPAAGYNRPPGVTYTLSQQWLAVARAVTQALNARLILGINFEADDPGLAGAEANALISGLAPGTVQALELGNEPELYAVFPWYRTATGRKVNGRPPTYHFDSFINDYSAFAQALSPTPLAGPTISGPVWLRRLDEFLAAEPAVKLVTAHRYPLQLCYTKPGSPRFPSFRNLLAPAASNGLANSFKPYVQVAHAHGHPLRLDELNTVSCGADRTVSQTFASALWAIDALFEMVRVGVNGVNIHTFPGAGYELFNFTRANGRWRGNVAPEYYGLLMFAQATPPGSQLLPVSTTRGGGVNVWATLAPNGRVAVALINKSRTRALGVGLRLASTHPGTLERLEAPGVSAGGGVRLGGRAVAAATGLLTPSPRTVTVKPTHGRYVVQVPAASAALLTVPTR